jgi:hypothetical protein
MKSLSSEFSEREELEHTVAINKPGNLFLRPLLIQYETEYETSTPGLPKI